jgi:hypothetical protein
MLKNDSAKTLNGMQSGERGCSVARCRSVIDFYSIDLVQFTLLPF